MLAENTKDTVTLVPFSGVQFLEYGFDIEATPRFTPTFIERPQLDEVGADGLAPVVLLPNYNEISPDEPSPIKIQRGDDEYELTKGKLLEPFLDKWVPLPFLALRPGTDSDGLSILAHGPSNWARVKVSAVNKVGSKVTHKVMFAFDTQLVHQEENHAYAGLTEEDARNEQEFLLAHRFNDLGWFFSDQRDAGDGRTTDLQEWVEVWIREVFYDCKRRLNPRRPFKPEDLEHKLEHAARYIGFLNFLKLAVPVPTVKLIDTVSDEPFAKPVNVDLILDIGNSRSCGILIESFPTDDRVDLGNSMVLQLRDLTHPHIVYTEPFESHVELAQADFGPEALSKLSGRLRAFFWPGLVRIGPEAARFREEAQGTGFASGMSSPKRYLWDTAPVLQEWRFQPRDYDEQAFPPLIDRVVRRFVNPRGDVLSEVESDIGLYKSITPKPEHDDLRTFALKLTFSRSSFFTFMVGEILAQAISMINNFQVRSTRKFTDSPRRLNRLILTLPTSMPVREQRIMRSRVTAAVRLVWDLMDWSKVRSITLRPPDVVVQWDEASCVQFTYLYTEIVRKFSGDIVGFFDLVGRPRSFAEADQKPAPTASPQPSLRVASIDIGGGTTDLMVCTYYEDGRRAILPVQTFREGFRIAGDDVLKAVIEQSIIPCVAEHLSTCGLGSAHEFLNNRFGGNRANMSEQDKHMRRQFVLRVLRPLGLAMLRTFESSSLSAQQEIREATIGDLVTGQVIPDISDRMASYVEEEAQRNGAAGFKLRDVRIAFDYGRVRDAVYSVLDTIFDNIAEALHHFDCDVVLLAGRPSRLPATVDLLLNKLPVSPDRLIPLHEYRVGSWYPFATSDNVRIADPKTATVVGGMLCALAERQIMNLTIYTGRLTMRSTAKYIGPLENNGTLREENVLFNSSAGPITEETEAEVKYFAPMRIGSRQLPFERWTATPLYRLTLGPGRDRIALPVTVLLNRRAPDEDVGFEEVNKFHRGEALREEIDILDAFDAMGAPGLKRSMQLTLDTMGSDEGYWLDNGILTIN